MEKNEFANITVDIIIAEKCDLFIELNSRKINVA